MELKQHEPRFAVTETKEVVKVKGFEIDDGSTRVWIEPTGIHITKKLKLRTVEKAPHLYGMYAVFPNNITFLFEDIGGRL